MSVSPDVPRRDSPPHDPAPTPAGLAKLLADAYADADALRRELAAAKKRADHADRLVASLQALRATDPDKPDPLDVLKQWEQRALAAEHARDEADVRRNAIESSWGQLNNYLVQLESVAADARAGFARVFDSGGPYVVPALPAMPARHRGRALFPQPPFPTLPLPPHPGSRRPRTPSIDGYAHPPAKKSRGDYEPVHGPQYAAPPRMILPPSSHLLPPQQRPRSRSRDSSRSSSSSTSVGDMILQASEGQPNPNGVDPANLPGRRKVRQDHVSPPHFPYDHRRPYPEYQPVLHDYRASPKQPATVIITGAPEPHAQPGQAREFQTHIFAPVVTGAPVKKPKFPQPTPPAPHGDNPPAPPPVAAFPPTNEQGQRICRQCGMPGRYKDGKCVEKWGPGPMGPGTVCDRCRKKMKRVERRGTLETQQQHSHHLSSSASISHLPRPQTHSTIHRADTLPAISSHLSLSSSRNDLHHPSPLQPNGASRPPRSPGPSIAALRDDDDLPRAPANSRSDSRNGVRTIGRATPVEIKRTSPLKHNSKRSSRSPGSVMDMDADGDADDDADEVDAAFEGLVALGEDASSGRINMDVDAGGDAEQELLEAVDAAEANSSNSSSNGARLKEED